MNIFRLRVAVAVFALTALMSLDIRVQAQDIHFSQFYASPLTLNPALTGKVNGNYRIAGIFRSQWRSVPSGDNKPAFGTPAVSFDLPIFVGKNKSDALGVGAVLSNDYTNGGNLNRLNAMASVSYIKGLGNNNKHQLSVGLQAGILQNSTGTFTFGDELAGGGNADQGFNNQSSMFFNMNAGIFYNGAITRKTTFYTGFSLFNLTEPEEQLGTVGTSTLPRRYVVHGGFDIGVGDRWSILPGLLFMNQAASWELNGGVNFGYKLSDGPGNGTTLYFGGWFRRARTQNESMIAMIGLEIHKFRAGFSYDANISSDLTAANARAFEISLIYVGNFLQAADENVFMFCPRY